MRFAAGLLLVVAAVLKGAELIHEPAVLFVSPLGQWFLPVQVGVELGLGLGILSRLYWRQLRWIALLVFTAFATYSLNFVINGAASCGCFGPVKVHPWWAFSIDIAIALGLLLSIVRDRTRPIAAAREWLDQTPVAIKISDAVVTSVSTKLLALLSAASSTP